MLDAEVLRTSMLHPHATDGADKHKIHREDYHEHTFAITHL